MLGAYPGIPPLSGHRICRWRGGLGTVWLLIFEANRSQSKHTGKRGVVAEGSEGEWASASCALAPCKRYAHQGNKACSRGTLSQEEKIGYTGRDDAQYANMRKNHSVEALTSTPRGGAGLLVPDYVQASSCPVR